MVCDRCGFGRMEVERGADICSECIVDDIKEMNNLIKEIKDEIRKLEEKQLRERFIDLQAGMKCVNTEGD